MIEEIAGDFLQWLRGFYFVTKRKSVTHAALDMGRNQPTVIHQIFNSKDKACIRALTRSVDLHVVMSFPKACYLLMQSIPFSKKSIGRKPPVSIKYEN